MRLHSGSWQQIPCFSPPEYLLFDQISPLVERPRMSDYPPEDTKQEIISAARRHFAHYGFHKVTMSDIARAVGLGKASLYYYVPTKEDLFREVVVHEQSHFLQELSRIAARNLPASTRLISYINSRYAFMNSLLHLNILDVAGSNTLRPMLRKVFADFVSKEITLVASVMQSGVTRREFDIRAPRKTAETLVHSIQGLRLRFVRNAPVDLHDYRRLKPEILHLAAIFIRGLQRTS
jgi:AcrR family transcriptional regulator